MRGLDALRACFDPCPRRGDVGATAEQVAGDVGRNRARGEGQRRASDREPAIRPLAEQCGEPVAGEADRLVDLREIRAFGGNGGVGLLEFGTGIEPDRYAVGDELVGVDAGCHCVGLDVALGEQACEIGIGAGDVGREQQPRLGDVERGCIAVRRGGAQVRAVPAPQIEIEADVETVPFQPCGTNASGMPS